MAQSPSIRFLRSIGCRAQSTARSAGGGKKRRQGRTGGSRRGEATQGGTLMDDYGDEMTRLRS